MSLSVKINICIIVLLVLSILSTAVSVVIFQAARADSRRIASLMMPVTEETMNASVFTEKMRYQARTYSLQDTDSSYNLTVDFLQKASGASSAIKTILQQQNDEDMNAYIADTDGLVQAFGGYLASLQTSRNETVAQMRIKEKELNGITSELLKQARLFSAQILDTVENSNATGAARDVLMESAFKAVTNMQEIIILTQDAETETVLSAGKRVNDNAAAIQEKYNSIVKLCDTITPLIKNQPALSLLGKVRAQAVAGGETSADLMGLIGTLKKQQTERSDYGNKVSTHIDRLTEAAVGGSQKYTGELYGLISKIGFMLIASAIVMLIAGLAVIFFINRNVTKKLRSFVSSVKELNAGDADLSRRIPVTSKDEIGQLAENFNKFVDNVNTVVGEVKSAANDVAAGNSQLASTMEELTSTFADQTTQIASVANNMEMITVSSQEMVKKLEESTRIIGEASNAVTDGKNQVSTVFKNIMDIKEKTAKLSITVSSLAGSSGKIGDILSVINDIADQTNLLALNAAIEAARAGDAGRGFAVVADEVRKLAERTQRSTSEISAIISDLQKESASAYSEMSGATESVEDGLKSVRATDAIFESIVSLAGGVNSTNEELSRSVSEQFGMVEVVNDNTRSFASGLEESTHVVNEVSRTVSGLQMRAESLKSTADKFKV